MGVNATIRAIALTLGDSSAADQGLDGYFDKVVITGPSGSTTYDFEPALTPVDKDQCKKSGWMTFNTPQFKNQGDCVSFVESKGKTKWFFIDSTVNFHSLLQNPAFQID